MVERSQDALSWWRPCWLKWGSVYSVESLPPYRTIVVLELIVHATLDVLLSISIGLPIRSDMFTYPVLAQLISLIWTCFQHSPLVFLLFLFADKCERGVCDIEDALILRIKIRQLDSRIQRTCPAYLLLVPPVVNHVEESLFFHRISSLYSEFGSTLRGSSQCKINDS